jgi:hypothetical protein
MHTPQVLQEQARRPNTATYEVDGMIMGFTEQGGKVIKGGKNRRVTDLEKLCSIQMDMITRLESKVDTLQARQEYIQRECQAQIGATNASVGRVNTRLSAMHELFIGMRNRDAEKAKAVGNAEEGWSTANGRTGVTYVEMAQSPASG